MVISVHIILINDKTYTMNSCCVMVIESVLTTHLQKLEKLQQWSHNTGSHRANIITYCMLDVFRLRVRLFIFNNKQTNSITFLQFK